MVGVLTSDSPWAGICICKKPCHVGEGTRTELALCALLACINLKPWCACGQTKQRDYSPSHE